MKLVLELRLVYRLMLKLESVLWLGSSLGQEIELPVRDRICLGLYLSFIVDTIAKVLHPPTPNPFCPLPPSPPTPGLH